MTRSLRPIYVLLVLLVGEVLYLWTKWRDVSESIPHSIDSAYIICLEDCERLKVQIQDMLMIKDVKIHSAHRGKDADVFLPLYTRHIMANGRHDHMQIPNNEALGCLLSHDAIWRDIVNGSNDARWSAVFEDDSFLHENSLIDLGQLWKDVENETYSILMLESGHINSEAEYRPVGLHAAECDGKCNWLGTRAYVIGSDGAQKLHDHLHPIAVQVDALIGLVASYDPDFRLFWTRRSVVQQNNSMNSRIYDGCVKCYFPTGFWPYLMGGIFVFFFLSWNLYSLWLWRTGKKVK